MTALGYMPMPADFRYRDVCLRGKPELPPRHPAMDPGHRAKIFAPFAALSGFDDAVKSKQVPYVPRRIKDAEETRALNRALEALHGATRTGALARQNRVRARVEYFEVCTDPHHEAFGRDGLYRTVTDVVWKVDPTGQTLTVGDKSIPFSDIHRITL